VFLVLHVGGAGDAECKSVAACQVNLVAQRPKHKANAVPVSLLQQSVESTLFLGEKARPWHSGLWLYEPVQGLQTSSVCMKTKHMISKLQLLNASRNVSGRV
jgi:hypothetical protein